MYGLLGQADNHRKFLRIQGCAADKESVNVMRLIHKVHRILGCYRPSIQDRDSISGRFTIHMPKMVPDSMGSILGGLRSSYQASPYRPYRLICNKYLFGFFLAQVAGDIIDLSDGIIQLNAPPALSKPLPDAQDRLHPCRQYGTYLVNKVGIIIGMVFAPFRMPYNNIFAAELREHIC